MNQKHRTRKPRRALVAWIMGALVVLAAVLLVGCGGSSDDSGTEESSTASSGQAGGPAGFELSDETRACLEEQGVELPEPGEGPPGGGAPPEGGPPEGPPAGFGEGGGEMKKALEECGADLPRGKPGGPQMDSAAFRESIKEYASCMGENGYELPEPNVSGEGPVFKESNVDREDPKFEAADEKCESLSRRTRGVEARRDNP